MLDERHQESVSAPSALSMDKARNSTGSDAGSRWLHDHLAKVRTRRRRMITVGDADYVRLHGLSVDGFLIYRPKMKKDKGGRDTDDSRTLDIEDVLAMGAEKSHVG